MPKINNKTYLAIASIVLLISLFLSIGLESIVPLFVPIAMVGVALTIIDFKLLFYFLILLLPLSVELYFDNGFGTDFPDEPLMVLLMGVFIVYVIATGKGIKSKFFWHPITLFILMHLAWVALTTITSEHIFTSIKFFLAKTWYIVVFYFLAGHILKTPKAISKFIWIISSGVLFTTLYTLIRHSAYGFTFASINNMMAPFFRNHVNYAAMITIILPLIWFSKAYVSNDKTIKLINKMLFFLIPIFLIAIYFSYTRAAYIAVVIMIGSYFLLRYSLVKTGIIISLIVVPIGVYSLVRDNKFLAYAPEYKKTITYFEFDDLVEATYNLEDISTMERVYRWVGAYYMIQDKPVLGFGPGNFYNFYKNYTISKFKTYVSDNPEKSGIHNYYLMVLVEQGFLGLLFFIAIIIVAFLTAQRVYRNSSNNLDKNTIMMSFIGLIGILALLIINDLIESDKIGPLFFIFLALIVNTDTKLISRQEKKIILLDNAH